MDSSFQCSPALHRRDGEPCLPKEALDRLRVAWNKTHPKHKLPASKTRKNSKQAAGVSQLWKQIRSKMKSHYKCDTEYCAVKKIKELPAEERREYLDYFRPEKPAEWDKKKTQWLDSYNIENVMKQYEKAESNFEFIGPVPIDFDSKSGLWGKCIVDELCKLDLAEMQNKGKTKIGIIYNLDPHDMPGSHWVCSFVDLDAKKAYYFDSYGYEPPEEIVRFLERCKKQGCTDVYYNDIRHQRKGSECGMYCLYCIICLIRGRPFYTICKNIVDDDTMNSFRDILFAEETPRKEAIEKALPMLCI